MNLFSKSSFFVLLMAFTVLSISSCVKIKSNYVMKGLWSLNKVTINGGELNQMAQFLEEYGSYDGCCTYSIEYFDEGVMVGEYLVGNTLKYSSTGEWEFLKNNQMFMKVDEYIDGVFDVEKTDKATYELHSLVNNISLYNIGEVEMTMYTTRTKK